MTGIEHALLRRIEALESIVTSQGERLAVLERQRFEIHEHHHYPVMPEPRPLNPWEPSVVWCGV